MEFVINANIHKVPLNAFSNLKLNFLIVADKLQIKKVNEMFKFTFSEGGKILMLQRVNTMSWFIEEVARKQ
jgi:hypothetical protein